MSHELRGFVGVGPRLHVDEAQDALSKGDRNAIHEITPGARLHDLPRGEEACAMEAAARPRVAANVEDHVAPSVPIAAEGDATGFRVAPQGGEGDALRREVGHTDAGYAGARDFEFHPVTQFEFSSGMKNHQLGGSKRAEMPPERGNDGSGGHTAVADHTPIIPLEERAEPFLGQLESSLSPPALPHPQKDVNVFPRRGESRMDLPTNPKSEASEIVYESAPVFRTEHGENRLTRLVEQQAAKMPSLAFLVVSSAAMLVSLVLELSGRRRASRFIGMWPGPILTMGVYNKLVKTFGAR